jgi:methylmalonyl-CoA mutase N-terminal domain/subunit
MGPRTFDEALGIPSDKALKLSLRAQQIVAYETGVTKTIDPLAGSYYIEWLTDELERRILDYLGIIERQGGMVKAIESGWIQKEIANAAYEYQKEIERGDRIVVGINKFAEEGESDVCTYVPSLEDQKRTIEALKKLRQERDSKKVKEALKKLHGVAQTEENIVPATVEAVRNYATVGEICGTLKEVFGEFKVLI